MLTTHVKELIKFQFKTNAPRLTGVFFRKHLGQSMYDDNGMVTEFAELCHEYFNSLVCKKNENELQKLSDRQEELHDERMKTVKKVNRSIVKSKNMLFAKFVGSLRYELNDGELTIRSDYKTVSNVATKIRSYLRSNGVNRVGITLLDGLLFKGDSVTDVLDFLSNRQIDDTSIIIIDRTIVKNKLKINYTDNDFRMLTRKISFLRRIPIKRRHMSPFLLVKLELSVFPFTTLFNESCFATFVFKL